MKKITLLTAALLSTAALGSQTLTAQAAGNSWQSTSVSANRKRVVISYKGNCDLSTLLEQWKDCFPSLVPSLPESDTDIPESDVPGTDTDNSGNSLPECDDDQPDSSLPDNGADTPGDTQPDSGTDQPDSSLPDNGTDTPDGALPDNGTDSPDTNVPGGSTDAPEINQPEDDAESSEDTDSLSYAEQIVKLVNTERAKEGLSPLTISLNVQAAAQVRAKEIVTSFSHTRPNGSSFSTALKEQNVSYRGAGENIAWGQRSPEEVVNAWMNSAGHRANIMSDKYTSIGVGYYQESGVNYWVQLFTY